MVNSHHRFEFSDDAMDAFSDLILLCWRSVRKDESDGKEAEEASAGVSYRGLRESGTSTRAMRQLSHDRTAKNPRRKSVGASNDRRRTDPAVQAGTANDVVLKGACEGAQ